MTSPAPWRLYLNDDIIAADDVCVARKHWDVHEGNGTEARWRADARLICAAPEMKVLLEKYLLASAFHGHEQIKANMLGAIRTSMKYSCDDCGREWETQSEADSCARQDEENRELDRKGKLWDALGVELWRLSLDDLEAIAAIVNAAVKRQ